MTDQQHPITLPPELRQLWAQQAQRKNPRDPVEWQEHVATQAAQWGSDQELEACCEWLDRRLFGRDEIRELRAARRPKPSSLKEQALEQLCEVNAMLQFHTTGGETSAIRRALEALDD